MTDKERIIELKKYTGLSFRALAEEIGLKSVQTIYDIKNGKHGISKDVAERIHAKYLNLSMSWLLTGEGSMFESTLEPESLNTEIDVDLEEQVSQEFPLIPVAYLDSPDINIWKDIEENSNQVERLSLNQLVYECDLVHRVLTDVMSPDITIGDILFLKKVPRKKILNGECYLINSKTYGVLVRYTFAEDDEIKCMAPNRPQQDLILPMDDIYGVYAIRGKFSSRITYSENSSMSYQAANNHISQLINEVSRAGERVDRMIALLEKQMSK